MLHSVLLKSKTGSVLSPVPSPTDLTSPAQNLKSDNFHTEKQDEASFLLADVLYRLNVCSDICLTLGHFV